MINENPVFRVEDYWKITLHRSGLGLSLVRELFSQRGRCKMGRFVITACMIGAFLWTGVAWSADNSSEARYLEGKKLVEALKFSEAKEIFSGLLEQTKQPKCCLLLGFCELALGNSVQAKASMERARDAKAHDLLFGTTTPYTLLLMLCQVQSQDPTKAKHLMEQILRSNIKFTYLRLLLGNPADLTLEKLEKEKEMADAAKKAREKVEADRKEAEMREAARKYIQEHPVSSPLVGGDRGNEEGSNAQSLSEREFERACGDQCFSDYDMGFTAWKDCCRRCRANGPSQSTIKKIKGDMKREAESAAKLDQEMYDRKLKRARCLEDCERYQGQAVAHTDCQNGCP